MGEETRRGGAGRPCHRWWTRQVLAVKRHTLMRSTLQVIIIAHIYVMLNTTHMADIVLRTLHISTNGVQRGVLSCSPRSHAKNDRAGSQ